MEKPEPTKDEVLKKEGGAGGTKEGGGPEIPEIPKKEDEGQPPPTYEQLRSAMLKTLPEKERGEFWTQEPEEQQRQVWDWVSGLSQDPSVAPPTVA